jgi:hypothetical protein
MCMLGIAFVESTGLSVWLHEGRGLGTLEATEPSMLAGLGGKVVLCGACL